MTIDPGFEVVSVESRDPSGTVTYQCAHNKPTGNGFELCLKTAGHSGRHRYSSSPSYWIPRALARAAKWTVCLCRGHRWGAWMVVFEGPVYVSLYCLRCERKSRASVECDNGLLRDEFRPAHLVKAEQELSEHVRAREAGGEVTT